MVSIVLPVYNREKTIRTAVESILNQTYSDFELIIVDDGSSDKTRDVILGIDDSRVKYIFQKNSGACAARNTGIDAANGEYIAFHDSDDIWHEDKLEKQMAVFEKENVQLVFCKLCLINDNKVVEYLPAEIRNGKVEKVESLFGIGTQAIIAKRVVFDSIRFDVDMPRFQEFEMLIRIVEKGFSLYCLDEGLVDYFIGEDSISKSSSKMLIAAKLILNKHTDFRKKYVKMSYEMSRMLINVANKICLEGNSEYKNYLKVAYKYDKSVKAMLRIITAFCGMYAWLYKKMKVRVK